MAASSDSSKGGDARSRQGSSRVLVKQYLIRWTGYQHSDDTWETAADVNVGAINEVWVRYVAEHPEVTMATEYERWSRA